LKLTVFQAAKGDCLLLESSDGKRVLVDGGMPDAYTKHVRHALLELGGEIDLLYVSHVDEDHIGGVEGLLNDEFAWRVWDYQRRAGKRGLPEPDRPPKVKAVWHNAFDMQVGRKKAAAIENALATSAALLEGSPDDEDRIEAANMREFATGVDTALRVSHRVSGEQLGIPLNKPWRGKLAVARDGLDPIDLGSLTLTVIGPYKKRLDELRAWWDRWLEDGRNADQLEEIRRDMVDDAKALETGDVRAFRDSVERRALEFSNSTARKHRITEPNLASLMLLVEEDGKTLLLTGDGSGEDIVEGLERTGHLKRDGGLHVDVLKVQHHGATANVKPEFCRRVTADHYILCGNGDHGNPEPEVLKVIVDSRLDAAARGDHAGADRPFKLWFNSSKQVVFTDPRKKHMTKVEDDMVEHKRRSRGRLTYQFLRRGSSLEIPI
jgi:beta-lactamase superfamily II metal-dependent hydrolase